jgi:hypothetical protein
VLRKKAERAIAGSRKPNFHGICMLFNPQEALAEVEMNYRSYKAAVPQSSFDQVRQTCSAFLEMASTASRACHVPRTNCICHNL